MSQQALRPRSRLRLAVMHPLLVMALVFVILPFLLPVWGSTVSLATQIEIYTLYALGFNLLLGYTGLVSFGASAYFGVASYAAGEAFLHLVPNMYLDILLGTAVGGATGLGVGALILRRRGLYFSLLTLAFTQLFYEIAFHWTGFTGGENGLQGISRTSLPGPIAFHFFVGGVVLVAAWLIWRMAHAPFGRVLQAIRDNEQRVRCLGYDTFGYKLASFALSSLFIALAGSLLTFLIEGAYADNLNWQHAGDPVMMTILGGIHHFLGPLWGSAIFIILSDQLSSITEHWWLIFGAILIGFILLSPEGVSGIASRLIGSRHWHLTRTVIPPRPPAGPHTTRRPAQTGDAPLLVVQNLHKRFGRLTVADGIGLDLRPGELHSLIGPNGAGKTTFFNMLTGLLQSDGGRVLLKGQDITAMPVHRRIGLGLARSFQIVSVFRDLSVFETVRMAVQARSPWRNSLWRDAYELPGVIGRTWELLDLVGLSQRAAEIGANLSHGEQRVLEIAVTLATDPEVVLLDEPLAGLGDAEREQIGQLIRRLAGAHAILLIEHDIDRVLAISDRITVLHQGRVIAAGAPSEIASHPEVASAYLGQHGGTGVATAPLAGARRRHAAEPPILHLEEVTAGYDGSRVLDRLNLEVRRGEVVALLGRNGVGKTTTLHTIMGVLKPSEGRIQFGGTDITCWSPDRINRQGISIVPEGRRIFPNLTVLDNLLIAQRPGGWSLDETYQLFPKLHALASSRGRDLSGGERQMLAIARALAAPTSLMLLDEPLEGLAPAVVMEVLQAILKLRDRASILIVEQKVDLVLPFAERAYVMVNGRIAHASDAESLLRDEALQMQLLGV